MGEVSLNTQLQPNKDLMSSKAYSLGHRRAGTVSLNLSHSEDEPFLQQSKAYRNVSFLITTGEITSPEHAIEAFPSAKYVGNLVAVYFPSARQNPFLPPYKVSQLRRAQITMTINSCATFPPVLEQGKLLSSANYISP